MEKVDIAPSAPLGSETKRRTNKKGAREASSTKVTSKAAKKKSNKKVKASMKQESEATAAGATQGPG